MEGAARRLARGPEWRNAMYRVRARWLTRAEELSRKWEIIMLTSVREQFETTNRRGATQNLVHLRADARRVPPPWVLDAAADRKLDGGYKNWRSNICDDCREVRSVAGTCGC